MSVINVTLDNFEEVVLNSDEPVLVDFWAPWCGPCKMLGPIVDQVAESASEFKVAKVNVDDEQGLAVKYNIASIPCLVVFENGEEKKRSVGLISQDEVLALVKEQIL